MTFTRTTKLYRATGTVFIDVEANTEEEARREARKVINELRSAFPTGVSLGIAEHHQTRDIAITQI
jgi:hypothetical protein